MAHVPTRNTRCLGDISFHAALETALKPTNDYDIARWLFVPNTYTEYRYILGTRGTKPLICIGVNPSTAAPDHLDPTLQSVERIARNNGFDSFIMLNVYAQRATSPRQMDEACHAELHQENLRAFQYALSLTEEPSVWAAWGNIIETRPYLADCLADMIAVSMNYRAAWYHCGRISKKGHPHHPLYLRKDEMLTPFDVNVYKRLISRRCRLMDMRKVGFLRSTYTRIKEFNGGIITIRQNYPTVTLEEIRRYIQSGDMGGVPAELCTTVDHLEAIREEAIRNEMVFLSAKAKARGKTVPNDLLNGNTLDPLLSPSVYDIAPEFQVFECFSWYSPEEAACFEPREF